MSRIIATSATAAETDPIFAAWQAAYDNHDDWDTAFGWGDHAMAGYLTSGDISGKEDSSNKSTNVQTDGASDTKYPSVKAIKDYTDGLVAGLLDYRGGYDASGNTFPATGGSGTAGAIMQGDTWVISVAGTLGGVAIQAGDTIISSIDTPGQTSGNWNKLNTNIFYTPEDSANKVTTISGASTDTEYPSAKLLYDQLANKQPAGSYLTAANIEDSISDGVTDKAPSENAVFDALAGKQPVGSYAAASHTHAQSDITGLVTDLGTISGVATAAGAAAAAAQGDIDTHEGLTNNPHSVTKTQVGLSNVPNTDCTTTANITDSTNKRFVTDANLTVIGNTSGTNTGDQSLAGLVPTTRTLTINGTTHDLSANRTWTVSSALSIVTTDPVSPSNGDAWIFQESRAGESQGALGAVSAGVYLFRIKTADGIKQSNLF